MKYAAHTTIFESQLESLPDDIRREILHQADQVLVRELRSKGARDVDVRHLKTRTPVEIPQALWERLLHRKPEIRWVPAIEITAFGEV